MESDFKTLNEHFNYLIEFYESEFVKYFFANDPSLEDTFGEIPSEIVNRKLNDYNENLQRFGYYLERDIINYNNLTKNIFYNRLKNVKNDLRDRLNNVKETIGVSSEECPELNNPKKWDDYIRFLYARSREFLAVVDEKLPMFNTTIPQHDEPKKNFKDRIWFKVGLKFATGEAQNLYEKYKLEKGHFVKIALELGFKKSDRPYFSSSIGNSIRGDKNIFSTNDKLLKIRDHCLSNKISICEDFLKHIKCD